MLPDVHPNTNASGETLPGNYGWAPAHLGRMAVLKRSVQAPGVAFEFDAKWAKNPNAVPLSEHGRNACCILTPGSKYEQEYSTFQPIIEGVSEALFMQTTDLIQPVGVMGTDGYKSRAEVLADVLTSAWSRFVERADRTATYRMPESSKPGYNWYATPTGDVFRIAATPPNEREAKRQALLAEKFSQMEADKALPPELMPLCNAVANNTYVLLRFSAKLWTSMRLNMLPDDVPPPARPLFAAMLQAGNWKSVNQLLTGAALGVDKNGQSVLKYNKTVYVNLGQFSVVQGSYMEPPADGTGARVGGTVQLRKPRDDFRNRLLNPASAYDTTKTNLDYLLSTIIMRGAVLYGSANKPLKPFAFVDPKTDECKPDPSYMKLYDYVMNSSAFEGTNEQMYDAKLKLIKAESEVSALKVRVNEAPTDAAKIVPRVKLMYAQQDLVLAKLRWRRWEKLQQAFMAPVSFDLRDLFAAQKLVANAMDNYLGFYNNNGDYVQNQPDGLPGPRNETDSDMNQWWHVRAYAGQVARKITVEDVWKAVSKDTVGGKQKYETLIEWYKAHVPYMQSGNKRVDPLAVSSVVSHDNAKLVRDAIRQMLYAAYEAHRMFITAEEAKDADGADDAPGPCEATADAEQDRTSVRSRRCPSCRTRGRASPRAPSAATFDAATETEPRTPAAP